LDNPRIQKSGVAHLKTFTAAQRTQAFNEYWKDVDLSGKRRKVFPVEFWQLEKLIKKTKQVAFTVKNIQDPNVASGKWAAYDPAKPPVLKEPDYCFVLSEKYFKGEIKKLEIQTKSHSINGLSDINQTKGVPNILLAMIGKDANGYLLFIQNAVPDLLDEDPGGTFDTNPGGEGAGGIRIP
jgi:hypothetical protein